jgi:hypothetical protein
MALAMNKTATALPKEGSLAIRCSMPEMLPKLTYNILLPASLAPADDQEQLRCHKAKEFW